MNTFNNSVEFPNQRVGISKKRNPEWYANCIDYVINAGLAANDREETKTIFNVLRGVIPDDYYKKTLNPYNSSEEKYTRFPATMRNLDIINDVVRRYVSEYHKGIHQFIVGAENPDLVLNKDMELKRRVMQLAEQEFQKELQRRMAQAAEEAVQNGQDPSTINPQDVAPDMEQFIAEFNESYIDNESVQAQNVLSFIRSMTDDNNIYNSAFFNYVTTGECYTYADVRGPHLYKECVPIIEAYPVSNGSFYVEDYDMFARRMMMSYEQIIAQFDDVLTKKDRDYLNKYFNSSNATGPVTPLTYSNYFEVYPEMTGKFNNSERDLFKHSPINIVADNNTYEVWHVVWRGMSKKGILTFINEMGVPDTRVVEEGYVLNEELGDVSIEWEWITQIYEGYRIGGRSYGIYPIKARPIAFSKSNKLPYNGIKEILPYMGSFSIVKTILPYQLMRNIVNYHREMAIAKNKQMILVMPESLISDNAEDKLYKMAADNVLLYDDSEDTNSLKAQQIRMVNANMGDYINQLTMLMDSLKLEARELVDMNAQRYGDIAQSAGADVTREATARASMGFVVIVNSFDLFRCKDYNRDVNYCKLAYVEGLNTMYWNLEGERKTLSLDVESFINSDYSTTVRNDAKEVEKLEQIKQWAFSAAQNGELKMAIAAINSDNVAMAVDTINKIDAINKQHEEQMQQMEQQLKQEELQNNITLVQVKGEEERKSIQLKAEYDMAMAGMKADVDLSIAGNNVNSSNTELAARAEANKTNIANQKLQIDKAKLTADMYNQAANRAVKIKDIESKERIAKINKNKYDK